MGHLQEEPAAEMAAGVPVDGVGMEKESNSGERAARKGSAASHHPAGCSDGDFAWANGERSYVWAVTSSSRGT